MSNPEWQPGAASSANPNGNQGYNQQPSYAQGSFQGQYNQPTGYPGSSMPPQKKSKAGLWVGIGCGALLLLALLVGGGVLAFTLLSGDDKKEVPASEVSSAEKELKGKNDEGNKNNNGVQLLLRTPRLVETAATPLNPATVRISPSLAPGTTTRNPGTAGTALSRDKAEEKLRSPAAEAKQQRGTCPSRLARQASTPRTAMPESATLAEPTSPRIRLLSISLRSSVTKTPKTCSQSTEVEKRRP